MKNGTTSNIGGTLEKRLMQFAKQDIRLAVKHGEVIISQTRLGTLTLKDEGYRFRLSGNGIDESLPATAMQKRLTGVYDVVMA